MPGKLILIGCGPGAADLLTFRAANRIAAADLVLYDRLIDPDVLKFVGAHAETGYVGKRCGDGGRQQADIDETRRELGWAPQVSLEEGIQRQLQWLLAQRTTAGSEDVPHSEEERS